MKEKQIKWVWVKGYGDYYVTSEKEATNINHFKDIEVFSSAWGLKIICLRWNNMTEIVYTTHASVRYTSESESNNDN